MPASSNKGGQAMAYPDVCMTAAAPSPIPIPYPNICMFTGAKGSTCPDKVKFDNKKPVCQGTVISSSSGDEAGSSPGGCVCGQNKKEGEVKLGSGCVKITPAHDPNDYEVGKRQNLPMINILNPEGTLNSNAGAYEGQTVLDARKNVVADLEKHSACATNHIAG